ncbi:hypothetical protein PAPHI01_0826 [Pancytospora philotis]|nr:hypothetical protein PAPHI01_0826 [Pancytospora philotis]
MVYCRINSGKHWRLSFSFTTPALSAGVAKEKTSRAAPMLPLGLFKELVAQEVRVHLSDRSSYTGCLRGFDSYVNIAIENAVLEDQEGARGAPIPFCMVNGMLVTHVEVV